MMSKPKVPDLPPTPTRADASVITKSQPDQPTGFSVITNSQLGKLQPRAQTGKTITTGGTTGN